MAKRTATAATEAENPEREPSRPPTLRDIARRVGVSQATVSAILSESSQANAFAESTRNEVKAAAEAMGYTSNPLARALRRTRSGVLGCLLFNQLDIYYARLAQLLEAQAREAGYGFVGASMGYDFGKLESCLGQLTAWRVEGIVLMLGGRPAPERLLNRLRNLGIPYVLGDSTEEGQPSAVANFAFASGMVAAEHLYELGHRDLAVMGVNPRNLHSQQRLAGLESALAARGLGLRDDAKVALPDGLHGPDAGFAGTETILDSAIRFTALVCLNDLLALGALAALREAGLRVPDDVSVLGFDDVALDVEGSEANRLGRFTCPPLTTVRLPAQEICRVAMNSLVARLKPETAGLEALPEQAPLLVLRGSTGPAFVPHTA